MTTELRCALCGAALVCWALGCFGSTQARHGDRVDVSAFPPEIQSAYRLFALRCSRCHTLARPLNAHITEPQHWVRYVTRMRRTPGSGINAQDAQVILRFLIYYTELEKHAGAERAPGAARDAGGGAP
jgi:hypothetical protein